MKIGFFFAFFFLLFYSHASAVSPKKMQVNQKEKQTVKKIISFEIFQPSFPTEPKVIVTCR